MAINKNFYNLYLKLQEEKMLEQDMGMPPMAGQTSGAAPDAPQLGDLASVGGDNGKPGMPQDGVPGMESMPQGSDTELPDEEDSEGDEDSENVDGPEGMDENTPEGKIFKAISSMEEALGEMKEKGSSLGDREETISDLIKMIKKNMEKSGEEIKDGEEEEEGPPIGDPAMMMGMDGTQNLGGQQDAANMNNVGMSNMPNQGDSQASPQAESVEEDDSVYNESIEMIRTLQRVDINDMNAPGVLRDYWSIRYQMESPGGELYGIKDKKIVESKLDSLAKSLKVGPKYTPVK
jgi:hypothetical protein